MIDTSDITNWTTWDEKSQRGVNRGDSQAYRNENREDYTVRINTRTYDHLDKSRVSVTVETSEGKETETFSGTEALDMYTDRAETVARNFMESNPCERTGDRNAAEALTDVMNALRDAGCPPQHDADLRGWTTVRGSIGFALRPESHSDDGPNDVLTNPEHADEYILHITVDGDESGLSYREYTERQNEDTIRLHEPRNPNNLSSKLQSEIESAGFTVTGANGVRHAGHQTHWDHSISYKATVELPDDLEIPFSMKRTASSLVA